jgi:hypothetical protein
MPSFIIFYKKVEILWITTMRGWPNQQGKN